MDEKVILVHGEGGLATRRLIEGVFLPRIDGERIRRQEDAAVLELLGKKLALTTDAFVVDPVFFPGGDIGKLAACGTVNDLAAMAAKPRWIAAAFVLEEGFPTERLEGIVESFSGVLRGVGAELVAADTKVVPKGQGGGVYISVAGVGEVVADVSVSRIEPGDEVVLSGDIARHAAAILAAREGIETSPPLLSDCAPLWELVEAALDAGVDLHAMRDPTRGGLATIAVEIAQKRGVMIELWEERIPVDPQVAALCDIYGFDPLYLANEGKMLFFVRGGDGERLVEALSKTTLGKLAAVVGRVSDGEGVVLVTRTGGRRKLIMLEGEQLPRIC